MLYFEKITEISYSMHLLRPDLLSSPFLAFHFLINPHDDEKEKTTEVRIGNHGCYDGVDFFKCFFRVGG
jgi:hypothetical protein